MTQALFVAADHLGGTEFNTSFYRIITPAKALRDAGHDLKVVSQPAISAFGATDVDTGINYAEMPATVLWERTISVERVEKMRAAGVTRIIVTFDDNYTLLPEIMVSSRRYWNNERLADWHKALGMVDCVIVASDMLAHDFGKYCKKIVCIPNYLDREHWGNRYAEKTSKVLGWGGSSGHTECWERSQVAKAAIQFLDKHTDYVGRFYGNVQALKDHQRCSVVSWVPFSSWPEELGKMSLGMAPLQGEYDRRRSWLKTLEFGACGIPFVGTDLEPFRGNEGSIGGILVKQKSNVKVWVEALEHISKPGVYKVLSDRGRAWAEENMMDHPVNLQKYQEVLWPTMQA